MSIKPGVEFTSPFRIYLPEEFFEVKIDNETTLVKPIALPPIHTQGTQVHGKNIEISHDIFGYAGRTRFVVVVDKNVNNNAHNWKKNFLEQESNYVDLALKSVNRMLEIYRDQDRNNLNEKSFHIIRIVKTDIYDIRIFAVDENIKQIDNFVVTRPSFHRVGFNDAVKRNPEIIKEIKMFLKEGTPLPIYRELLNSALNYIWRGQYRLVPVEANTAFESFIPGAILLLDKKEKRSKEKTLLNKLLKLEDILYSALGDSKQNAISWFDRPLMGWKSITHSAFLKWYNDCYKLRNKVIHVGYKDVTKKEAIKSYEASWEAIDYIQSELRKVIHP